MHAHGCWVLLMSFVGCRSGDAPAHVEPAPSPISSCVCPTCPTVTGLASVSAVQAPVALDIKFANVDELVSWLQAEGHTVKRLHGGLAFKLVHALDGDNVAIDGKTKWCGVFRDQRSAPPA